MQGLKSKLPAGGTTIFTTMSALAKEHEAINLGQGFPDFDCDEQLQDRIIHHLQHGKNQYCPMAGLPDLRQTLASKMERLYRRPVSAEHEITITAGATQGIYTIIQALVHAGDEVIVIEPAYDSYVPSIQLVGGVPVPFTLKGPDYRVDWDRFQSLVTDRTRMIIINTPQNPIGKTLKSADMEALAQIVKGRNIYVLSDEVYEHLVYDHQPHESVLKYPDLWHQSMAVYSFGKTFHSTGWKVGYVVGPRPLMAEFRKVHQWNVFSVNSFVQYGINDYLQEPSTYTGLSAFFQEKRDFLLEVMEGSRFCPIHSEGTYFQLFDYSEISDASDLDFARRMTTEFGVAAIPVSPFYLSGPSADRHVRLCFAKTPAVLERAGERLRDC